MNQDFLLGINQLVVRRNLTIAVNWMVNIENTASPAPFPDLPYTVHLDFTRLRRLNPTPTPSQ